jgi:hypothetical protein
MFALGAAAVAVPLAAQGTSRGLGARLRGSAAAADAAQRTAPLTRTATPDDSLSFDVDGGIGVATFQDIQVPVNRLAEARADGSTAGQENADHVGFPLYGGMSLRKAADAWRFAIFDFDALTVRSTSGPAETQSASYSRLALSTGVGYAVPLLGLDLTPALSLGGRRSSFGNGSAAHYLEAVTAGGSFALARAASWSVTGSVAVAPTATFGYSSAPVLGGKAIEHSTAALSEYGLASSFHLKDALWLDLGLSQERAGVKIEDVSAYEGFGLHVTPEDRSSRQYDLATTIARLGVRKRF